MPDGASESGLIEGRRLRLAHLMTIDMSLALLLRTELLADVAAGYEVFGISAPGPYTSDLADIGITHVPVPALTRSWSVSADGRAALQLLRVLRDLRLDVLHTHNPKPGVLGRILGRLAGIPIVVNTCHGLWVRPEDGALRKILVYGTEAFASLFSDAELYQNDEDRRTLARVIPRTRAWTVGNGIDLERFRRDDQARLQLRSELGVAEDRLLVGGVGRLVREKGILEFAAAALRLSDTADFIWVGPDDEHKSDRLAGEPGGVRFLGPREDMVAVYSALDVFVLPSHREGFSRSAMEAAACACPMVLSDIRGCREIGNEGEHVLFVPPGSVDELKRAIESLLLDQAMRSRLGRAAQERAHRTFDQRAIARASLETYRRVALRKRRSWAMKRPPSKSARTSS